MDTMPHSWTDIFQSTLSMRRATNTNLSCRRGVIISIHALHEESDIEYDTGGISLFDISIHALHEESDGHFVFSSTGSMLFQSTLSMRRATHLRLPRMRIAVISIHALHEESDIAPRITVSPTSFQSTLSMRRATSTPKIMERFDAFQSTLSMRRATWRFGVDGHFRRHFNPRSP